MQIISKVHTDSSEYIGETQGYMEQIMELEQKKYGCIPVNGVDLWNNCENDVRVCSLLPLFKNCLKCSCYPVTDKSFQSHPCFFSFGSDWIFAFSGNAFGYSCHLMCCHTFMAACQPSCSVSHWVSHKCYDLKIPPVFIQTISLGVCQWWTGQPVTNRFQMVGSDDLLVKC